MARNIPVGYAYEPGVCMECMLTRMKMWILKK